MPADGEQLQRPPSAELDGAARCQPVPAGTPMRWRRPVKVWDSRRRLRQGIVVDSLQEVIDKGRQRLQLPDGCQIRVVLECDGTAVDDDDYLATLDDHTVLMLLTGDQQWSDARSNEQILAFVDETDAAVGLGQQQLSLSPASVRRYQLLRQLRTDPGYIALLSAADLELLANITDSHQLQPAAAAALAAEFDEQLLEDVQEASCCYLDGRRDIQDALSFIKQCRNSANTNKSGPTNQ